MIESKASRTIAMEKNSPFKLFYLISLLTIPCPLFASTFQVQNFSVLEGFRIDSSTATVTIVPSAQSSLACVVACMEATSCKSAEFDTTDGTCSVLDETPYDTKTNMTEASTYVLYAKYPVELSHISYGRMLFRGTPYIGMSMYDAWKGSLSSSYGPVLPVGCSRGDSLFPCHVHYRDSFLDTWNDTTVITLVVYKDGAPKAILRFNGTKSDNQSWMTNNHLISSWPWEDVSLASDPSYFSLSGLVSPDRRFLIYAEISGCLFDSGWLVVSDSVNDYCSYMSSADLVYPRIIFSPNNVVSRFSSSINFADALVVYSSN